MPDKLKDLFDESLLRALARDLRGAHPSLDERAFVADCMRGLGSLELLARGGRVAEVMHRHLPADFERAADILVRSLGPELESTESFGLAPLRYLPHVAFVARYGLDHFEASMVTQRELTKRFSAEWSIRAFLLRHPEATYRRLLDWTRDRNVHVRRLASEGTRPRLPWAPRLRDFQKDPRPVLRLLEHLKDDPERYVQRSVANNLNDIAKDHPELAIETCRRWLQGAPSARRWIVGHALRFLVKQGHAGALSALGFGAKPRVRIAAAEIVPRRPALGSALRFSFELVSASSRPQALLVDYVVHYVKANGSAKPKTFKLAKLKLAPRARARLTGRVLLVQRTTRTHHPGRHRLEALVNGVPYPLGTFELTGAGQRRAGRMVPARHSGQKAGSLPS